MEILNDKVFQKIYSYILISNSKLNKLLINKPTLTRKTLNLKMSKAFSNDKSIKGYIDEEILEIVNFLNSKDGFYTTSSCAGRIVLLERNGKHKYDSKWLFTSHQPISFEDIKKKLKSDSLVWFKTEPPILHIGCDKLEDAHKILSIAKESSLKRSGIISAGKRFIIEIIGHSKIDAVVIENGKVLVDDDYLKVLVKHGNVFLKEGRDSFEKFLNICKEKL